MGQLQKGHFRPPTSTSTYNLQPRDTKSVVPILQQQDPSTSLNCIGVGWLSIPAMDSSRTFISPLALICLLT
jgi:hypothetical protein